MRLCALKRAALVLAAILGLSPFALLPEEPAPPKADEKVQPASPEAAGRAMLELGELKVLAGTVWRIERSWLGTLRQRNPGFDMSAAERVQLRRQVAFKELEMALVEKMAGERRLVTPKEDLDKRVAEIQARIKEQGSSYEEFLASISKSDEEFRRATGATLALQKGLVGEITDDEVKQTLAKDAESLPLRRSSHVLYAYQGATNSKSNRTKEEARKLAEEALKKARSDPNFDFADLARKTSDCPSAQDGGDLNFSPRRGEGQMVPAFADALYAVGKVGEYSDVVETEFGFHVLKLSALRESAEFAERARQFLAQQKIGKLLQQAMGENFNNIKFAEDLLVLGPPAEK
jgi:parvulin-like peptidyl-prolyl isomerase